MPKGGDTVRVWTGDGETYLGLGTYLGEVDVHFFRFPDGHLESQFDAELEPSSIFVEHMEQAGAEHIVSPANPKIELSDGQIVYGCQVWWQPERKEEDGTNDAGSGRTGQDGQ